MKLSPRITAALPAAIVRVETNETSRFAESAARSQWLAYRSSAAGTSWNTPSANSRRAPEGGRGGGGGWRETGGGGAGPPARARRAPVGGGREGALHGGRGWRGALGFPPDSLGEGPAARRRGRFLLLARGGARRCEPPAQVVV